MVVINLDDITKAGSEAFIYIVPAEKWKMPTVLMKWISICDPTPQNKTSVQKYLFLYYVDVKNADIFKL